MPRLTDDHYIGCLVGGAIGDALGAPIEFMDIHSIFQKYGKNGIYDYVEWGNGIGEITDDTQMTLFTAEGLLRSFHRAAQKGIWGAYKEICFSSYLRWLYTQEHSFSEIPSGNMLLNGWLIHEHFLYQRRAPGQTCLQALKSGKAGSIENPINQSKGCGGIMRVAPVGLLFYQKPEYAFKIGTELAALTHGHPSGFLAAGFLAALIAYINQGISLIQAIELAQKLLQTYPGHEETLRAVLAALALHAQGNPTYTQVESLGEGWVAEETLSISLYCALSYPGHFEQAIRLSIHHSGDTDSTGAVTGNILGCLLGVKAIPERWKKNLAHVDVIQQMGMDLFVEVKENNTEWAKKYPPF